MKRLTTFYYLYHGTWQDMVFFVQCNYVIHSCLFMVKCSVECWGVLALSAFHVSTWKRAFIPDDALHFQRWYAEKNSNESQSVRYSFNSTLNTIPLELHLNTKGICKNAILKVKSKGAYSLKRCRTYDNMLIRLNQFFFPKTDLAQRLQISFHEPVLDSLTLTNRVLILLEADMISSRMQHFPFVLSVIGDGCQQWKKVRVNLQWRLCVSEESLDGTSESQLNRLPTEISGSVISKN